MKNTPTVGRTLTIAGFALSCFGLLLFLWIAFGGSSPLNPKGYRVEMSFDDATTLALQADVRSSGVPIGKVVAKRRDPAGNRTIAVLEIQPEYAPLRRDAQAILRQKTLLGETYVELTMGRRDGEAIPEGGRLANVRVKDAVEFDELLRIFDPDTREAFRQWQRSGVEAFSGEGETINSVLGNLPGFVENAQSVVDVLGTRREALQQLVRGTGDTFEAITRNEAALSNLVVRNREVFETLAGKREDLAESFRIFPTFLRESRATLTRLKTFSNETTPLVRDLEPVLEDAQPTMRSLRGLAPDLEALFKDFRPLINAGRTGLPATSRVLRGLSPTLAELGPLLQQLNPILEFLELYQTSITDFLNIGPSALHNTLPPRPGTNGHVLPQMILVGPTETLLPQTSRPSTARGNAYQPPDAYRDVAPYLEPPKQFSLPTWDCKNTPTGGEMGPVESPLPVGSEPGCQLAGGVTFQGRTTRYPQVEASAPGGKSKQPGR